MPALPARTGATVAGVVGAGRIQYFGRPGSAAAEPA